METHEYFEYYDSEKKKIKILKIFSKKNTKDEEIYRKIVEYANKYFSGYGNFHQKIENSIEINIPSYSGILFFTSSFSGDSSNQVRF